ncbi:LexA family transcriptional regulator [Meiothermus sp. PNK-Is4]|nr:LexA family transcriptional regulator [Meiothermus sp. PNK-Is4]
MLEHCLPQFLPQCHERHASLVHICRRCYHASRVVHMCQHSAEQNPMSRKLPLEGPFNDWIAERMDELGIQSVEEFARYAKIGRATMHNVIRGRVSPKGTWVKPSIETLELLAIALNRPIQDLIFRLMPNAPGSELMTTRAQVRVPVVGVVGAGPGQDIEVDDGYIFVESAFARGKRLAAYRVYGDSMCAGRRPICDGDIIVANLNDKGDSGSVVVARLVDGTTVCKALKVDRFGAHLMSLNPMYTNSTPPMIPASEVAEIVGKVIMVQGQL